MTRPVAPAFVLALVVAQAIAVLLGGAAFDSPSRSIHFENETRQLVVQGFDRATTQSLRVVLVDGETLRPVAGRLARVDGQSVFEPTWPWLDGVQYRAELTGRAGVERFSWRVGAGSQKHASSLVSDILPSAETVPASLLRLYVRFDRPMRRGVSHRFLQIVDAEGAPIEKLLRETRQELWDAESTQLTLLLNPGWVKSGVGPNRRFGAALEPGQRWTLRIAPGWPSRDGEAIAAGASRSFVVGEPVKTRIEPASWHLEAPAVGTRQQLVVTFDRALDQFLLESLMSVEQAGRVIEGLASVEGGGRVFRFRPDRPWAADEASLRIDPRLEDVSGNNLMDPFERASQTGVNGRPEPHRLAFRPRP